MLKHLHIRDFAIVDDLELDVDSGMTVLTGETGAGKSILLDALGLTLGDRADSTVVRHGSERADITTTFAVEQLPVVQEWLRGRELETDEECIIRRTVSSDGRSRGYINGRPVPVQSLKELGEQLVDIHGQHAHQSLLRRDAQRELLDEFAGHGAQVEAVHAAYRRWRALADELERLAAARNERESRLELLRYQVQELESLGLAPGELAELEEEHGRLANVNRLTEGTQRAAALLYDDEGGSVSGALDRILADLQALLGYDHRLQGACELLEGASIQVREAGSELRHYLADLEVDPRRIDEVEQRLADIQGLARKHRCLPEELPGLLERQRREMAELEAAETRLDGLEAEIVGAVDAYRHAAHALSAGRRDAAERLAALVSENMQGLGMGGGRFAIALEPLPEQRPDPNGLERVEFQVTTNPGQPLRPLGKVASGGELSRISLCVQVITAGRGGIPTLVFDEVDVGIGGGIAEIVGRQLRSVGGRCQVLCVTHQPQVAAQGHRHLRIRKHKDSASTRTYVELLAGEERVEEIARMLGGVAITEQTRAHAREMLELAQRPGAGGGWDKRSREGRKGR